ncbi:cyclase family protein [Paenarthrobacter ilicis]|uniref:Kynurenine formamidase n=1 Tax=Paenarthrobacter ilicis TaxID=43665 RepID=A0ABX0TLS1_9MICC|nr:cyclase family protein [Paenarthrobacter ilicis]MBM7795035.1 kynurenine formamidase [Paenarthrobacter ilicis]NIJ02666.1 kynurenine formamidase [Paenarthrobacter ilicis]
MTTLWEQLAPLLDNKTFTDLTHAFHPGQPHFPAFPDETREALFDLEKGDGFTAHRYSIVGQWGTHVDPPSHFIRGGRTLDQIPVEEMVLPLVVLDISGRVENDDDAVPTMADVLAWEAQYGGIPEGSFVALRTGWSKRWPNPDAMANKDDDGLSHTPGWSREVLEYLLEQRGAAAVGHEQTDTDPGLATSQQDFSLETYVLARNKWQIELLANLDSLPESGAVLIATWAKPLGGSGFPARVFAIH